MFDVLTYQKGGALLRMLEQYLGVEAFREGVSHYLRLHAVRQHRDQRPVGRASRRPAGEPVRRIMDSWIWQPGYPLVAASVERRRARAAPAAVRVRPRHLTPTRRRRGSSRSHVRAGRTAADRSCSTADEARLPFADRRRRRGQRRRARLLPGRLQRRPARSSRRRCPRRTGHARALQPRRRRLERGRRRPPRRRRLPRVRRAVRRRARAGRVAGDRPRAARSRPAPRRRGVPGVPDPGPRAGGAGPRRPRRARRRRGRPARPSCAGCSSPRWPSRATTRPRKARAAELFDRSEAAPGTVDPELVAAATSIVAAGGDDGGYERMLAGLPQRDDAAGSAAPPLRPGRVRRRGAHPAHVRAGDER